MVRGFCLVLLLLAGLVRAAAAQGVATTYVPTPAVDASVRERLVAEMRPRDPAAAAKLATELQRQDLRALWARVVAEDGLHRNDVADAVAAFWVLNWEVAHGRADNTRGQMQGVRRQVIAGLQRSPAFRALDDAGRQQMGDRLVYRFMLLYGAYREAMTVRDPALLRQLAVAAAARMQDEAQLDVGHLALTDEGLR